MHFGYIFMALHCLLPRKIDVQWGANRTRPAMTNAQIYPDRNFRGDLYRSLRFFSERSLQISVDSAADVTAANVRIGVESAAMSSVNSAATVCSYIQ